MNDKTEQMNKCTPEYVLVIPKHSMSLVVKYFIGRNTFPRNLDGDVSVDSDCEGDTGTW